MGAKDDYRRWYDANKERARAMKPEGEFRDWFYWFRLKKEGEEFRK